MYHQITLKELGMIPVKKQIDRSRYAFPCGGCLCEHCANNVNCTDKYVGEMSFPCFNCDDCKNYNGYGRDNWDPECNQYKVTEAYAKYTRTRFICLRQQKS